MATASDILDVYVTRKGVIYKVPVGVTVTSTSVIDPKGDGWQVYMVLPEGVSPECENDAPPVDPLSPVFNTSYVPTLWAPDQDYFVELYTTDTNLITPASGQTVVKFDKIAFPDYLSLIAASDSPTHFFITGHIPAGTTSLAYSLKATGSNGKTVSKSYLPAKKNLSDILPVMGVAYGDKKQSIYVAPDGSPAPFITIIKSPAGYNSTSRQQMPVFNTGILSILGGKNGKFRKLDDTPPMGDYGAKLEFNGYTLYGAWTLSTDAFSAAVTLSETSPGGGGGQTIAAPTVPAQSAVALQPGQFWTLFYPPVGYTLGAGQGIAKVEVIGAAPAGFRVYLNSNQVNVAEYSVSLNQAPGNQKALVRLTQTDGQYVQFEQPFVIGIAPFYIRLYNGTPKDGIQIGPILTDATVKVEGPSTDSITHTFEKFGADAGGKHYDGRYIGYKFGTAGTHVFTFVQGGVTQYASLVVGAGGIPSFVDMVLSTIKPNVGTTPEYFLTQSGQLSEGGTIYVTGKQQVSGQETNVSGAVYGSDNKQSGTDINSSTGQITVANNALTNDGYTLNVWMKIGGVTKATLAIPVADTTGSLVSVLAVDYAVSSARPTTFDIWIKTNGGAGALEWSYEVVGPGGYETPGPGGNQSGSVPWMALTAGSFGSGYTLHGIKAGMAVDPSFGLITNIYVRRVGTSGNGLQIPQPPIPATGSIARTNIYTSPDTAPINDGTYVGNFVLGRASSHPEWLQPYVTEINLTQGWYRLGNSATDAAGFFYEINNEWKANAFTTYKYAIGYDYKLSAIKPLGDTYASNGEFVPRVYDDDRRNDPCQNVHLQVKMI